MADLRPSIAPALAVFGADAVVTPPGEDAIETRVIWHAPQTVDVPVGQDGVRADYRRTMSIPLSTVPSAPVGTIVNVPEAKGEDAQDWKVDAYDRLDYDHHRVVVVPVS